MAYVTRLLFERIMMDDDDKEREALDLFGEIIVHYLKDSALKDYENIKGNKYGSGSPESGLSKAVSSLSEEAQEVIRDCIITAIATGVHDCLAKIDDLRDSGDMTILLDGVDIIRASDGINAEYMLEEGWEARFSEYPTTEAVLKKYIIKYGLEMPPLLEDYPV